MNMSILRMSLYGAVLILVVAVIRLLLLHRLPKRTFVILWSVVLLRLLVPIELSTPFSVYALTGNVLRNAGWSIADVQTEEGWAVRTQIRHVTEEGESLIYLPEGMNRTQTAAASQGVGRISWMTVVWVLGALATAGYFAVSYHLCMREFRMALPLDNPFLRGWLGNHRLRRKLVIRQLDTIEAPVSYGILRPTILLPKKLDWSNTDSLKYVLEHEFVHIQRLDQALKLVMIAAVCLHWFNPTVWLMDRLLNRDIELACDETVVRRFGVRVRKSYCMTLIGMEERKSGLVPFYNAFGANDIKGRIRSIMKMRKISMAAVGVAIVLVATISVGFLTSAGDREEDTAAAELQNALEAMERQENALIDYVEELEQTQGQLEEQSAAQTETIIYFEPSDIHDLTEASMELHGIRYTCDKAKLIWIENVLQGAQQVYGMDCPADIPLYLTRSDGTVGVIYPAMDSCDTFRTGTGCYEWGNADNSEFWQCFAIDDVTAVYLSQSAAQTAGNPAALEPEDAPEAASGAESYNLSSSPVELHDEEYGDVVLAPGMTVEEWNELKETTALWRISTNQIPVTGRIIDRIVARSGDTGADRLIEDQDTVDEIITGILEADVVSQDEVLRSGYRYLLILYSGDEEVQRFSISEDCIMTNQVWYFVDSNERILNAIASASE